MENKNIVSEIEITYKSKTKPSEREKITMSKDCERIFRSIYDINKIEHKEMFYAMYLNKSNKVLGVLLISEGGVTGTVADPKLIFQGALKLNATGIVLSHNHPSGNLQPSEEDKKLTHKIKEGAKLLDMVVIDHIIITSEYYLSFADEGIF